MTAITDRKPGLLMTASLFSISLGLASPALAQTTDNQATVPQTVTNPTDVATGEQDAATRQRENADIGTQAPAADEEAPRDIVVTGSRIRRPDFSSPSPIFSVSADTLQQSGQTNITKFLTGYPALVGSSTSNDNSGDNAGIGYTGLNLLNLRNLGTQRTLVLIDGRRQVAGVPGDQAIDINTIPSDLVEGIDVVTGGASAVYGADAVTGVVNFRLKQNFQGVAVHGQSGISTHGDAGQYELGATIGSNFADGRGNIAVAYEYGADNRLQTRDRRRYTEGHLNTFVTNPDRATDPNAPKFIPLTDIRYAYSSPIGAIDVTGDGLPEFDGSGAIWDYGNDFGDGFTQGGSATSVASYGNDLLPKIRRNVINALGHYDVSDKLTIFGSATVADVKSFSLAQPSFDYYIFVPEDNPYLPADVRAAIDPGLGGVLVNRDNFDLGQRGENIRRQTFQGVGGVRGDVSDSFHYEAYYSYGKTTVRSRYLADVYNDRFFAAVDAVRDPATGNVTCRVNVDPTWEPDQPFSSRTATPVTTFSPGQCQPLNLFSKTQSAGALAFITAPTTDRSSIEQQVASASISGDFRELFSLPGGPIGFALGGEYRKEKSDFNPDPIIQQGLTYTNKLEPTHGSFNVKEVYGELNAPLFKNVPLAYDLELGAAIRYSDYSTIGSTTTWKVDGMYAPIKDIMFRGTYSEAIRAPNIGELFDGQSQTFVFFDDPCQTKNLDLGTSYRVDNCRTLLTSLGANPDNFTDSRSVNIAGLQGGNPNLKQEKAKTWTAGIVLNPRFLPGFTMSADWYDIRLTNAINTVDPQQLAELCVDQPTLDNAFCGSITRENGGSTPGYINGFTVSPLNVAAFRTAGLDVNLQYALRTAHLGDFDLNLKANYLDKLSFIGTPGADPTDERGTLGAPKYQAKFDLTWSSGPITLNYGLAWFDKTLRTSNQNIKGDPNYFAPQYVYYKELWQHDIYGAYNVNDQFQFYLGVNNLANQKPAFGSTSYPIDSVGRFLYAGFKVKLDRFL